MLLKVKYFVWKTVIALRMYFKPKSAWINQGAIIYIT